jgi:hypothetical protein
MDMSTRGIDPKLADREAGAAPKRGLPRGVPEAITLAFLLGLLLLGMAIRLWVYLPHWGAQ